MEQLLGGVTFTGAASRSYDIDGSISAFSMIFGPSFDFDVSNNLEFLVGGGIGFSSYNDEVKSVGQVPVYHMMRILQILLQNLRLVLITLLRKKLIYKLPMVLIMLIQELKILLKISQRIALMLS